MEGARPAGLDDVPACALLLRDAQAAAAGRRGGPSMVADRAPDAPPAGADSPERALRSWVAGPGHVLLAGTLDNAVVGVAAGHVQDRAGERVGVVDCLYVEPGARGVGVGSALTTRLVAAFSDLGCDAVDAPALPGDRETKQRFEAAGFSARLLVLHRRLP